MRTVLRGATRASGARGRGANSAEEAYLENGLVSVAGRHLCETEQVSRYVSCVYNNYFVQRS